jgi:hypothetical protein
MRRCRLHIFAVVEHDPLTKGHGVGQTVFADGMRLDQLGDGLVLLVIGEESLVGAVADDRDDLGGRLVLVQMRRLANGRHPQRAAPHTGRRVILHRPQHGGRRLTGSLATDQRRQRSTA